MNKELDKNNFLTISACLFSILSKLDKIQEIIEKIYCEDNK